jgi:hypothetical protein
MNRHERRRARRIDNAFYEAHVRHLPQVPLNAPLERGRVYHMVYQHDDCCARYAGVDCNCNPVVTRYIEPTRS